MDKVMADATINTEDVTKEPKLACAQCLTTAPPLVETNLTSGSPVPFTSAPPTEDVTPICGCHHDLHGLDKRPSQASDISEKLTSAHTPKETVPAISTIPTTDTLSAIHAPSTCPWIRFKQGFGALTSSANMKKKKSCLFMGLQVALKPSIAIIAAALFGLLVAYVCMYLVVAIASVINSTGTAACSIMIVRDLEICRSGTAKSTEGAPLPGVDKILNQQKQLIAMQSIASDVAALPHHLLAGQSALKDLIFKLSYSDIAKQATLLPLVKEFDVGVEEAADGIQDCLSQTSSLIEDAGLINNWASTQLARIHKRQSSIGRSLHYTIVSALNPTSSLLLSEKKVQDVFQHANARSLASTEIAISKYTTVRGNLISLKDTLTKIAMGFLEDGYDLQQERLGEASYWKWVFKSHRQKVKDFDTKMELCASFYNYALKASDVITATSLKLLDVRYELLQIKNQLIAAPAALESGGSLQLTIDKLDASIAELQQSKRESKAKQKARVAEYHAVLKR